MDVFSDESLFLSLCFCRCVKTRTWVVKNVGLFHVRPSVLLTVLLGISKDPYPDVREFALNGLVSLSSTIVVDDQSMIEGCYFRAIELLFDSENSVRCAAVRSVSEWGQLLVSSNPDKCKGEWSDALFVQLALMSRDMDMKIRVSAFDALGKIQMVSKDILLQTLSKKVLEPMKEKSYRGQYTAKLLKIPASAVAFTFIHGLQDEFHEVRRSACRALQKLTVFSSEFAGESVHVVMDVLNDDSLVVRLQGLETLHSISLRGHLKVEESHLHMFFCTVIDGSPMMRSASRKVIQSTRLENLTMFRSCFDILIKCLELYPQDEAEIFCSLHKLGQTHGKFVAIIIQEGFQELEPSLDGKLDFHNMKTTALLVLAISAPVSLDKEICSISPQIFSYAVTLLGRISCGFVDVMDQNTLLAYLSRCSRFTFVPLPEFSKREMPGSQPKDSDSHRWEESDGISSGYSSKLMEFKKNTIPNLPELNSDDIAYRYTQVISQQIVDLWPLIQIGCTYEVLETLRSWKYELKRFASDPHQSAVALDFTLNYLSVIRSFGKVWAYGLRRKNLRCNGIGALLVKTEKKLKKMLYRCLGLTRKEEFYILELILVTFTLKLSFGAAYCFEACLDELKSVISDVQSIAKEGSVELSDFVIQLQNALHEIENPEDQTIEKLSLLQKCLECFSPKYLELSRQVKHLKAELDILGSDFENPVPFISGLPVGISLEIVLHNISSETRMWLSMTLSDKCTQFAYIDLLECGGCDEVRKFPFVALFYRTPKVKYFSIKVSIGMECRSEFQHVEYNSGPRRELVPLCEDIVVHLSTPH